ncbi:phage tail domain-containing protein [Staphylococcus pseudintermedius]|uniref:ORF006 n=1 Tax=Staphylococcus phage 2638A TaxID=320836 RepID=Q4ZD64_BP263|nr:phage tail domain-containing protein [Staphylococcus pseudintermedius]YP_239812.1 tail family protein [Staphylococcus phage 2638A]AAX90994.1 ORF006 [Staphylococcus phage 2638A]EGQ1742559.1 phage tail protein [Staphylococcus pseudintermedius]EGQ3150006.1 phage tail protein [Staphylococcus pseudintermedius]EGQ4049586.1 phage tail protein [Staphylococcus pseudintermedius]EHL7191138.1 phage tail family protein [Staphylococcus pseudintermedius]
MRNETIIVNGKKLKWLFVERGFKIPSFNYATTTEKVPGRPGTIKKSRELDGYEFDIPLIVRNDYLAGRKTHDDILNEVVKFFDYEEPVKLQFSTKGWYWNAYFDGPFEIASNNDGFITFNVQVVLTDPYKYAIEGSQNTAISDAVSVVNSGTADTPVIVEARALQNSNYYMISKGDEDYFMIGDDDLDKPLKDYSPNILSDEFKSFAGWTKVASGQVQDTIFGGTVGGSFKLEKNKEGFEINNFPEGNGWIGAQYKRGFSKALKDFKVIVKGIIYQKSKGAGKIAYHIYDTDNRLLATLGYINSSGGAPNGKFIFNLFNQSGDEVKILEASNVPMVNKIDTLIIYMSLERIGDTFRLKTWLFNHEKDPNRTKPLQIVNKTYQDKGNFYQRPVSSISVYEAKNTKSNKMMKMHALGIYLFEKLPKPVGARDMIIKKGDLIQINTATKSVVVNEESFLSEKTFGSDWINVDKGHTELVINPPGIFDTTVKWQDRYL